MMTAEEQAPFDPEDPFNVICEMFRMNTMDLWIDADKVTLFRDLDAAHKLNAFVAGAMTGIIAVSFACVSKGDRDQVVDAVREYIDFSRLQAEGLFNGVKTPVRLSRHDS